MPVTESSFGSTEQGVTAQSVSYGTPSASRQYETTVGNCKVTITDPTSGTKSDQVTFTYTLEDDRAATASIKPEYSLNNGGTWSEATKGTGGDNKTGLATSASGTSHTFVWNSATDLSLDARVDVLFRIRAYDQDNYLGSVLSSSNVKLTIDNAPAQMTLVSPTDGYFDKNQTPTFIGVVPNPIAGNSKLHFKIEFSDDNTFSSPTSFESRNDQTAWQYDSNGSGNWTALPAAGLDVPGDPTLIGRQIRFTIQQEDYLTPQIRHWRMTCGGVATL